MVKVARAKFTEPQKEYIPVVNENDPWTIKTVAAPTTSAEAVAVVKDIIGGTTDKDVPRCEHGEMVWATGTSKQGKQWGHFKCVGAASGAMLRCPKGEDIRWYEISPEGNWRPQKVRA
jgi:N-methylhydantoinase B/oxoprolinase/acetone carboxylase alpha subunit